MDHIRNFSIIAHVDHGKSTLSDRLIQFCGGLTDREMSEQVLDSMDLERERGITIKAQCVTLNYTAKNGKIYQLNFIDTPGHVDFAYEVSRSLATCEGALLVVDVGKGVEAQTLANFHAAMKMNLVIIPILNKIDLPFAEPDRVLQEIEDIIGIDSNNILCCSAKTGIGISDILERLVHDIPSPEGDPSGPLQALIIDSWFDNYQGIVSLVRIKNGTLNKGEKVKVMSTNQIYNVDRIGIFTPKRVDRNTLNCGEVGWLVCAIKNILGAPVGDTLTGARFSAEKALPGFKKIKPQVYASLFPINTGDYELFRDALSKLNLNDSSLSYEPDNSAVLGFGFRCGFLGLLHMEIIQERLKREYKLDMITTVPTVMYEIKTTSGKIIYVDNPSILSSINNIYELREPIAECHILLPKEYLGSVITLCVEKRGIQTGIIYHDNQVELNYDIPMSEIVLDFFDQLKSTSRGYASLDYNFKCFRASKVVCVDILINSKRVDALTLISHQDNAKRLGHKLVENMTNLIPRQQFDIIIQAAIGKNIIARSVIKQFRKNVIAKCYGGDVSRKKKLLQKQKKGKNRMKRIGNIDLPKEVFLSIFHIKKRK